MKLRQTRRKNRDMNHPPNADGWNIVVIFAGPSVVTAHFGVATLLPCFGTSGSMS
jgi:hypothetical protein